MNIKRVFRSWKVWLLIVCILMAAIAIRPNPWASGVAIRSVSTESAAALAGFANPKATATPMNREVINTINNIEIKNIDDYNNAVSNLRVNTTIIIKTNKDLYKVSVLPKYETTVLNQTEEINYSEEVYDPNTNTTKNITRTKTVNKIDYKVVGVADIGLRVYNAPKSNIKMGLDLQGGSRVILRPETPIADDEMDSLVENMKQRLNVYGLSDIVVRRTSDLEGKEFIIVEIAGASDDEVKELLAKQGKFEGKIGNDTMFKGGSDIKHVCKTADCSMIRECNKASDGSGYFCTFTFSITLSPESAQRQADRTKSLDVKVENGEGYLSEPLDLYLDDEKVDTLQIGESLKGRAETEISISGNGAGITQQDAMSNAASNMKKLQTILLTGSLPVKLVIEDSSNISPTLGSEFIQNTLMVGLVAMILVVIAIMIRYRKLVVSIPVAITLMSEVLILLGFAAIIGWNIDLIAIAAIIIAIGTGIDSQVVIIDEIAGKHHTQTSSWKDKIKNAFFIIMASYFTMVVAMFPLLSAGAGLLKGFAITTILGVSIGVFITRPAFAVIAETLIRKEQE